MVTKEDFVKVMTHLSTYLKQTEEWYDIAEDVFYDAVNSAVNLSYKHIETIIDAAALEVGDKEGRLKDFVFESKCVFPYKICREGKEDIIINSWEDFYNAFITFKKEELMLN